MLEEKKKGAYFLTVGYANLVLLSCECLYPVPGHFDRLDYLVVLVLGQLQTAFQALNGRLGLLQLLRKFTQGSLAAYPSIRVIHKGQMKPIAKLHVATKLQYNYM